MNQMFFYFYLPNMILHYKGIVGGMFVNLFKMWGQAYIIWFFTEQCWVNGCGDMLWREMLCRDRLLT